MMIPLAELLTIENSREIPTPALALFPRQIEANVRRMVELAGDPRRLWPHVKTHKLPQVVAMQRAAGIEQFKCATLVEAEMLAEAGAERVLWAFQAVGPNIGRMAALARSHRRTQFGVLIDDARAMGELDRVCAELGVRIGACVDLDTGMGRTGVAPGNEAERLYRAICRCRALEPWGLHVYDGHVKMPNLRERQRLVEEEMRPVEALRASLEREGFAVPQMICGGSPTFGIHARVRDRACSPGTCVLWDFSYESKYAELGFGYAAILLSRVVSKPRADRVCLDLGYKAVACDSPQPRAFFPQLPGAETLIHNEEHWALECPAARALALGDVVYAVPWHVCPTCALHERVWVVEDGRAGTEWPVVARSRRLREER